VEEEPKSAFRTKVRVKARSSRPDRNTTAPEPTVPPKKPISLMEALEQVRASSDGDAEQPKKEASGTKPPARSHEVPQPAETVSNSRTKSSRSATARAGRLAAAKLRQLQRLQEAAASLEKLARGEIEEATVEIIRRDSKRPTDNQATNPQKR